MKLYIITGALIILLTTLHMFQVSNDQYLYLQSRYKAVANDCADAAALFYDQEQYSVGIKTFNKSEGNAAIREIMSTSLELDDSLHSEQKRLPEVHTYYTYYFDSEGMTVYYEDRFISNSKVEIPYSFSEPITGFKEDIKAPTVIVTIAAGIFDYRLLFITNPELIRTSGYEYIGY